MSPAERRAEFMLSGTANEHQIVILNPVTAKYGSAPVKSK